MNEFDLLKIFYDEIKAQGSSRESVFISIDENVLAILRQKFGDALQLKDIQIIADTCIANEWLERTTADPHYNFLSLTEAGLQVTIARVYQ